MTTPSIIARPAVSRCRRAADRGDRLAVAGQGAGARRFARTTPWTAAPPRPTLGSVGRTADRRVRPRPVDPHQEAPDERDRSVLHHCARARPALSREDALAGRGHRRGARPDRASEPEAQRLSHGHGGPCARAGTCGRGAVQARPAARAARRHPLFHQGSRAHGRHPHHLRLPVLRAQRPDGGRRAGIPAPRLGGRAARQDQHAPLRLQGHVRQPDRPTVQEPLEPHAHVGGLLGRRGIRGRGRARASGPRVRRLRLDPHPLSALRHLRPEALARPGSLLAERRPLERALPQRPHDADRPRRGDPAAGHGGPRSPRSPLHRRAARRLPGGLRRRRAGLADWLERRSRVCRSGPRGRRSHRAGSTPVRGAGGARRGGEGRLGSPLRVPQDHLLDERAARTTTARASARTGSSPP